jgi:hypothetical protein
MSEEKTGYGIINKHLKVEILDVRSMLGIKRYFCAQFTEN